MPFATFPLYPQRADVGADIIEPPVSATSRHTRCSKVELLDHFVGDGEHVGRDYQAERLGGLQVDYQFELGRLQNRQVGGLLAFEDATRVDAHLAIQFGRARSIAYKAASDSKLAPKIESRQCVAGRERDQVSPPRNEKRTIDDEESCDLPLDERGEGRVEVPLGAREMHNEVLTDFVGSCLRTCNLRLGPRIVRVNKHADGDGLRYQLAQQSELFRPE